MYRLKTLIIRFQTQQYYTICEVNGQITLAKFFTLEVRALPRTMFYKEVSAARRTLISCQSSSCHSVSASDFLTSSVMSCCCGNK